MAAIKGLTQAMMCLFYISQCSSAASVDSLNGRKVILVSMDGFRYDYFQKANTPNFDAMIASGAHVPYVNNTFVTLTFPCHTTIVTGLYEESHGMIGNQFYDPVYKGNFYTSNTETKWWNASEPIWTSAVKSGLKVGVYFWPGSTVSHGGIRPTVAYDYDSQVPFLERVDTAVGWLSRDGYDFATMYFREPDHSGHMYGPDDPRLVPVIEEMDSVLGHLMTSLENATIKDKVDVIVTSDHGMSTIDVINKVVDITDYVNDTLLDWTIPWFGADLNIMPQPGRARELADALDKVEHLHAFVKEDIPEHFHYGKNRRVMPVFVYADDGWIVTNNKTRLATRDLKGFHGYDNTLMTMKPIFVASGPSFKTGYRLSGPIKSVDIYPLLCHLLNLTPAPNNGTFERVKPLLRQVPVDARTTTTPSPDGAPVLTSSLALSFICLLLYYVH